MPALHTRPDFARLFGAVDLAITSGGEALRVESTLTELLHALAPVWPLRLPGGGRGAARVEPARDYLHAHFAQPVTLAHLAALCGLHPGSLVRAFRSTLGLPPHVYQQGLRLQHARRLINAGVPLARAALEAGFADQSHFTRAFTRVFGLPPGQYARGSDRSRRTR
ncbi:hypothetical protein DAETH_06490 [Deinococcus aetherius]|uniref:HTH araC/xylS-type domain-containing protein n=1 Tax=Deinococcus aetherius TaxID=200252 RepID=A0ABM8AAC0_9DEIO|nr:hypothetical protein DAETH_06490 [Deinococcus aetherius]